MPFVLREDGATDNPPLATVYGEQSTESKLAYFIKSGGRTKCICILGEGEMDGINKIFYNGETLPEFSSTNPTDRNWRFHAGTITTQIPTLYDVTAISGDTLTLASNPFTGSTAVRETSTATGGTKTYSYLGQTTAPVAYNASASTVQTALDNLSSVTSGAITVSGSHPNLSFSFAEQQAQWSGYLTLNTGSLTGGSSSFTRPAEISFLASQESSTSNYYPVGVKQHQKLYVVYSVGNNIKVSLTPGGAPLVWTSSQYLLDNMRVYPATSGFFDSMQGRPEFFPTLDFTLSGISYLEVNLPAEMSEIEDEPSKFKIFVRGKRLQNYDANGQLADANGVAYNPLALPAQTKFFSANNALVALDIILNYMKVDKSRIDFPSWVAFREHCYEQITWNSGATEIFGNPLFTFVNTSLGNDTTITKTGGVNGTWDAGALTTQSTTSLQNIQISGVYRGGHSAIGLTRKVTAPIVHNDTGNLFSIHPSTLDGRLRVYEGTSSVPIYNEALPFREGDVFRIEIYENKANFYKNDTLFHTTPAAFGAGVTRGFVSLNTVNASYSDIKFFPVTGTNRTTNRFDAHLVFPSEVDCSTALQQVMGRCPSVHWQDVNGKIKFIVGSTYADYTWDEEPVVGQRVLADVLSFDPNSTIYLKPTADKSTTNHALYGTATSSSQASSNFPISSINNGNNTTNGNWATSEGWAGNISNVSALNPEWVQISFGEKLPIKEIGVYTLADALNYNTIVGNETFTLYGIQDFLVQYWNGQAWTTIQSFVGNNKTFNKVTFPTVMTDKIRVYITKAADGRARIVELRAVGSTVISTIVPKSNIIENSFSSYKTPPENKPNFLRIELRDLDDPYYTKKYVYNDRDALRDQTGTLIDFGIVPVGVATQSLADRIGESTMRWNSDLDLFISLKGAASTYPISKGDIVKVAHDVTGWGLDRPVEFIVVEETIESGNDTADEKTYLLQAYNSEYYSDNAHGAITANFPTTVSALSAPPAITNLDLSEENRTLPDGTNYSAIVGRITFDINYPYSQRARIYWKRALDVEFIPTNIVIEQPNTSVNDIPFELNFAQVGLTQIKVVTETLTGVVSSESLTESVEVSGTVQIEEVDWESLVNVQILGANLKKITGVTAWDAGANSTKSIAYGNGYMQWSTNETSSMAVGFSCYNYNSRNYDVKYGILMDYVNPLRVIVDGVIGYAQNPAAQIAGPNQSYKIEITSTEILFYQVINSEPMVVHRVLNQQRYPLYVDTSFYAQSYLTPVQIYGNLELTTGIKAHWQSLRGVNISVANGIETITKAGATGWSGAQSSGTYSYERIPKNGAVEWIATETTTYRLAGLSEVDAEISNPDINGFEAIKYALYTEQGGALSVREFGVAKHFNTYVSGDILRIERINGVVYYRKNGQLIYTSLTLSTAPLYVDTAFYTSNSTLKDFRVKRIGNFSTLTYPYPIYLVQDLIVLNNRPQEDGSVYFELAGVFASEGEPIQRAKVKVYNKYGALVSDFPEFTYAGNGMIGSGFHDRKYADPYEEAIYEVRLDNGNGMSAPIYVKNTVESFTMPALLNPALAPQDLICVPIDHNKISVNWSFSTPVDVWIKPDGGSWSKIGSNINVKPHIAGLLQPNTYYEFKIAPVDNMVNWSNICRAKTLQAPLPAETSPPPLSVVATQNSGSPTTAVDLSWNRNSTTNTGIKVYKNGTLLYTGAAGETSYTATGLTANTSYTFKVKNVYAGGDSIDSNIVTITTSSGASPLKPSGLSALGTSPYRINLFWTNNTASGSILIEVSYDGGTSWSTVTTVPATTSYYPHQGLEPDTGYSYRVSNTGVTGYSNVAYGFTFSEEDNCVVPNTLISVIEFGRIFEKQARFVKVGDVVVTVKSDGSISTTKVKKVRKGFSDTLNIITTKSGKTLECTPSHPLIKSKRLGIQKAVSVKSGSKILVVNDSLDKVMLEMVESKETLYGEFDVVIFELEDTFTFISNGIVSHNRKED